MTITHRRPYDAARRLQYPQLTDQLDAIYKGFVAIRDSGLIVLPAETLAWLDRVERVKARCPKAG
ncbi:MULTISPECIES: hypothetical protein [unclassified Methylococcus]|uniref:hypothetical protein n=1 Tax=unclassified Methylococcus TaxID=2618889 RepID=UPI003D7E1F75